MIHTAECFQIPPCLVDLFELKSAFQYVRVSDIIKEIYEIRALRVTLFIRGSSFSVNSLVSMEALCS